MTTPNHPGTSPADQSGHYNRPGQSAIRYRQGTHPTIYQRLLAALDRPTDPSTNRPNPLAALATRDLDDPTLALLDSWALVGDVISFYQERVANEGYLRTATEARSIQELAATLGHRPNPGVAATAYLAFTVNDSAQSAPEVVVPAGIQVKSVPSEAGQLPQTFETARATRTRAEWNKIRPKIRPTEHPPLLGPGNTGVSVKGTQSQLEPGDALLILEHIETGLPAPNQWCCVTVRTVKPDTTTGTTEVSWGVPLSEIKAEVVEFSRPQLFALRQQVSLFGHNAPVLEDLPAESRHHFGRKQSGRGTISSTDGLTVFQLNSAADFNDIQRGDTISVDNQIKTVIGKEQEGSGDATIYKITLDSNFVLDISQDSNFTYSKSFADDLHLQAPYIDLATVYGKVLPGSWCILQQPEDAAPALRSRGRASARSQDTAGSKLYRINSVATVSRSDFGLNSKITRLTTDDDADLVDFTLRQTTALIQSDPLELMPVITAPDEVAGKELVLPLLSVYPEPGQPLIIGDDSHHEVAYVQSISLAPEASDTEASLAILTLQETLGHSYNPDTITLCGNIAVATHGETVEEILGSGDGSQVHQRFQLKKPPLTYIPAANASGSESTLKVYVNNVLWQEVRSLHTQAASSHCYTLRFDNQGTPTITFGDGIHGARLPSGRENIRAVYRTGTGSSGLVNAGALILLQAPPLGIRSVTNPLPTTGAANPEPPDQIRKLAPLTVSTLDRVVSLKDFETFSQTFAGVGKAQAKLLWTGDNQRVHITLADAAGQADCEPLCRTLEAAIATLGNLSQPLRIDPYQPRPFNLEANLTLDPRYLPEVVLPQAQTTLKQAFAFSNRDFGQGVAAAEIMSILQSVEGVLAVDLQTLYFFEEETTPSLNAFLPAHTARWEPSPPPSVPLSPNQDVRSAPAPPSPDDPLHPAELLILNQATLTHHP